MLRQAFTIVFAITLTGFLVSAISEAEIRENIGKGSANGTPPGDLRVISGSVNEVDMDTTVKSDRWAGIYGNASGKFVLGGENSLFSWESSGARYVYLSSRGIDFDSDWKAQDLSDLVEEYPFLENGTDSASKTFNSTITVDSVFQDSKVKNTIAAYSRNSTGQKVWPTAYLSDGSNGFFAGEVRENSTAFNGVRSDYQMILPQNISTSVTSYSVWIELED